jgi:hypothetical protein
MAISESRAEERLARWREIIPRACITVTDTVVILILLWSFSHGTVALAVAVRVATPRSPVCRSAEHEGGCGRSGVRPSLRRVSSIRRSAGKRTPTSCFRGMRHDPEQTGYSESLSQGCA